MIYKKDANFPYPILTNTTSTYMEPKFLVDIDLEENTSAYRFKLDYEISSVFIRELIEMQQATVIFIIQSKDTRFVKLAPNQTFVDVEKSRISLSKRTSIQLQIQTNKEVTFEQNTDLTAFYAPFKNEVILSENKLLGFSNVVIFDGSIPNPLILFEKKLNEQLTSDIKIELGAETIIIHYRKEEYQFNGLHNGRDFNTPYLYAGLQKALHQFIVEYGHGEDFVELAQIDMPENPLYFKIYNLMVKKMISEISYETIDEVISLISQKLIEKYAVAVKELDRDGD